MIGLVFGLVVGFIAGSVPAVRTRVLAKVKPIWAYFNTK